MNDENRKRLGVDRGKVRIQSSRQISGLKKALEGAKIKTPDNRIKNMGRMKKYRKNFKCPEERIVSKDAIHNVRSKSRSMPEFRVVTFELRKSAVSERMQDIQKEDTWKEDIRKDNIQRENIRKEDKREEVKKAVRLHQRKELQKSKYQNQKSVQDYQSKENNFRIREMKTKLHIQTEADKEDHIQGSFDQDTLHKETVQKRMTENTGENRMQKSCTPGEKNLNYYTGQKDKNAEVQREKRNGKYRQNAKNSKFAKNKKRAKKKFQKAAAMARMIEQQKAKEEGLSDGNEGMTYVSSGLHMVFDMVKAFIKPLFKVFSCSTLIIMAALGMFIFLLFGIIILLVINVGTIAGSPQAYFENAFVKYYCNPAGCSGGETVQWAKIKAKNSEGQYKKIQDHVFCQNCW